jgi:hypothetical protein
MIGSDLEKALIAQAGLGRTDKANSVSSARVALPLPPSCPFWDLRKLAWTGKMPVPPSPDLSDEPPTVRGVTSNLAPLLHFHPRYVARAPIRGSVLVFGIFCR